jgi:hypothetical protein
MTFKRILLANFTFGHTPLQGGDGRLLADPIRSMMPVRKTVALVPLGCHGEIDWHFRKSTPRFNTALLRAATELVPSGAELVTETLHDIPCGQKTETAENTVSYPPPV